MRTIASSPPGAVDADEVRYAFLALLVVPGKADVVPVPVLSYCILIADLLMDGFVSLLSVGCTLVQKTRNGTRRSDVLSLSRPQPCARDSENGGSKYY